MEFGRGASRVPVSSGPMSPARALAKARMAELLSLRDKRKRQEAGRYLVEGFHVVEEALLASAPVEEVLFAEGAAEVPAGRRIAENARAAKVRVTEVGRPEVERLSDVETPQGVVAVL